jgi:hypothetical protein
MTITQLIQASPAKANELFIKLADTSDGALKTRERLFSEPPRVFRRPIWLTEVYREMVGWISAEG